MYLEAEYAIILSTVVPIAAGHPLLSAPSRLGVPNMNLNHPTPRSITALEIQLSTTWCVVVILVGYVGRLLQGVAADGGHLGVIYDLFTVEPRAAFFGIDCRCAYTWGLVGMERNFYIVCFLFG